jgi:16S rRNA (uracil1498-N3)-methyltransferase
VRQFLLPGRYAGEQRLHLTDGDFRHLTRVRRLREGDTVPAVDERGGRYLMRIARVTRDRCEVELSPEREAPEGPDTGPYLTLLQCLPKGRKMDLIVRQAAEAGVRRIVPLSSENSQVRPADADARGERLLRIAREALQQSGAPRLPVIDEPRPLAWVTECDEDWGTALFFHEQPLPGAPLHRLLAEGPGVVSLLVGPEGGLSAREVELLRSAGWKPVHLATGVLRVETAALYAVAAVATILQERDAWRPAEGS